jgi:hypothetical protein
VKRLFWFTIGFAVAAIIGLSSGCRLDDDRQSSPPPSSSQRTPYDPTPIKAQVPEGSSVYLLLLGVGGLLVLAHFERYAK